MTNNETINVGKFAIHEAIRDIMNFAGINREEAIKLIRVLALDPETYRPTFGDDHPYWERIRRLVDVI